MYDDLNKQIFYFHIFFNYKIYSLLGGITQKVMAIYFYSFRTENKFKYHSKYVKIKIYGIIMSSKKHNILRFKQYMQSHKMP